MIRFADIETADKPKKSGATTEAKMVSAPDLAASNPKPAKRVKKSMSAAKATKR